MESKAPVAVMQEVYVNGVSTRKVGHLVQQLGLAGDAKEHRLACARARMTQVPASKRPLEDRHPYLWLDAKVERVGAPGGVRYKSVGIA